MAKLILVRHGETATNVEGKLHSVLDSSVLTERGIQQIHKTSHKLRDYHPVCIYSSDESRATQSAELIAATLGISLETLEDLRERNWGEFSGKPWSEVKNILDSMTVNERYTYLPPGGESWLQFEARLVRCVESIIRTSPERNIVVVTHGGVIRALMPYLLGAQKEESFKYDPDNASITVFEHINGIFNSELVNSTDHLI